MERLSFREMHAEEGSNENQLNKVSVDQKGIL